MKKHLLILAAALLSISTFAQIPNYVPANGLVGWWPFNGNANDESGNGNNGTVNGATLTQDRFGNSNMAYSFDGVDDLIEVLHNPIFDFGVNPNFSISLWINKHVSNSGGIICKGEPNDGFNWDGWNFINDDFQTGYPCLGNNCPGTLSIWNNYSIIIANGLIQIYINNSLSYQYSCTELLVSNISTINNLFFGVDRDGNNFYSGKIDDIGIWNRALTACEIQDLYHAQLGSQAIFAGADQSICSGDPVTLNSSGGSSYQWNNNVIDGQAFTPNQSANYVVNGTDSLGCQGTDTVVVTVLENAVSTLTQTALDSYTLNGQTYTQSGTYTQTVPAANGCDSTITLNLTLNFTGLDELGTGAKKLVKITDLNGKIIPRRKNTLMLFIYEDGTIERVVEMEE